MVDMQGMIIGIIRHMPQIADEPEDAR